MLFERYLWQCLTLGLLYFLFLLNYSLVKYTIELVNSHKTRLISKLRDQLWRINSSLMKYVSIKLKFSFNIVSLDLCETK